MEPMEVWLAEEVALQWKSHWHLHKKVQQLWKPGLLRLKGGDLSHGGALTLAQLKENLMDDS